MIARTGFFPYIMAMKIAGLPLLFCALLALAGCKNHSAVPNPVVRAPAGKMASASSSEPYGEWQVVLTPGGAAEADLQCYLGQNPSSPEHKGAYLLVARRHSGPFEVSVSSGLLYTAEMKISVILDRKHSYRMIGRGNVAWAHDELEDKTLIEAMKTARSLQVRALNASGIQVLDTYNPDHFRAAFARIGKHCP